MNKSSNKNHSTALNVNKSFGCKPFNSQWVSSEHLVTLRAVEWFLSELLFTSNHQPQQDLSPQSTPPRSRSPRYLRRSPPSSPPFNGFEPAQMKPDLNWSQLDEEFEETNELDKCFYEPASIIHIELSYKSSVS